MVGENGNVWPFQPDPSLTSAQFLDGREGGFRMQEGGTAVWPKCNAWNKSGIFFNVFLPPHVPGFVDKLNLVQNSLSLTKVSLRFFEFNRNCQLCIYCSRAQILFH